jgi:hypothetical protein
MHVHVHVCSNLGLHMGKTSDAYTPANFQEIMAIVHLLVVLCSATTWALNPTLRSAVYAPVAALVRTPLLTRAADRRLLRMCAADGSRPLQRLVVPDVTEVQRPGTEGVVAAEGKTKTYGNDDAIHAQLAASRLKSYQQDRKGCCSKASSYLDSTMAPCDEATRDQAEDA